MWPVELMEPGGGASATCKLDAARTSRRGIGPIAPAPSSVLLSGADQAGGIEMPGWREQVVKRVTG